MSIISFFVLLQSLAEEEQETVEVIQCPPQLEVGFPSCMENIWYSYLTKEVS